MAWPWVAGGAALLAVGAGVAVFVYGPRRWSAATQRLIEEMKATRESRRRDDAVGPGPGAGDGPDAAGASIDAANLPAPVRRYLRKALGDGAAAAVGEVSHVHMTHNGTFNMGGDGPASWKPFRSRQFVQIRRPGFVWDARVYAAPGVTVHVHDAYVSGRGVLTASLQGLVTVMSLPPSAELDEGELLRFLAEATWYPMALVPYEGPDGAGLTWEAIDERSARVTLRDGAATATLTFFFGEDDLVARVRCEGRGRATKDGVVLTPWEGRVWNYTNLQGVLVPLDGEVAWDIPGVGRAPYWRGHVARIEFRA